MGQRACVRPSSAARGLLLLATLGLFGLSLLTGGAASAHAMVVMSDPVDGPRSASAPAAVTITFNEHVGLDSIGYQRVIDQVGRRTDDGPATHPGNDGTRITVRLNGGVSAGTYTASFRVLSADSHPIAGAIRFVVGNDALAATSTQPPVVDAGTSVAFDAVRWIAFTGLVLLGGGWLMFTIWPAGRADLRARRLLYTGWWLTAAGALAGMAVQGPYSAGSGLGALADGSLLDATLHTTFGLALISLR